MDIQERLKSIIKSVATHDIDVESITDETILTEDLKFDSIQLIELIVELESEFDIVVEEDDLEMEIITVYHNIYEMIIRKINGQA